MKDQHDPVDSALTSLGGRRWPGEDQDNNQLKAKIMQEYSSRGSSVRHRGAIVATLAFLALGTVGFGAVGGFNMVRSWFITVEIDGVPVDVDNLDIVVEENGDSVTLTVDSDDLDLPPGSENVTISITASPDQDAKIIFDTDEGVTVVDLRIEDPDDDEDNDEDNDD